MLSDDGPSTCQEDTKGMGEFKQKLNRQSRSWSESNEVTEQSVNYSDKQITKYFVYQDKLDHYHD